VKIRSVPHPAFSYNRDFPATAFMESGISFAVDGASPASMPQVCA
jgi:hypothetical protein